MDKQYFDNNQGVGGFEVGGYDRNAIQPTDTNWTRQSRFGLPKNPKLRWSIVIPDAIWMRPNAIQDLRWIQKVIY